MQKTIQSAPYQLLIQWIKTARITRGATMRELAVRLGVSHTWIGKIEQCERRLDLCEFVRLCDALDLDPHIGIDLLSSPQYATPYRKTIPQAAERPSDLKPTLK